MKLNSPIWFYVFSFLVSFASCQQHESPAVQQRFRIKKVTKNYPKSGSLPIETSYTYTNDGWLASAVSQTTDGVPAGISVTFLYDFDQKGRVAKATTRAGSTNYLFSFDSTGRLTSMYSYISVSGYESLTQEDHLIYGNSAVPVRINSLSGRLGMARDSVFQEYTYSGDNIVQVKFRIRTQTTTYDKANYVKTYQYDDKVNPYYRFIFGYYLDPDWTTFSKNNVLNDQEVNTYDSNGLLTKVTQRDGAYDFTYEYEVY